MAYFGGRKPYTWTEIVIFDGVKYYRNPKSTCRNSRNYFRPEKKYRDLGYRALHQEVWKFHNGPIPSGHHIHHKDGNRSNNDISNLECMTAADHFEEHKAALHAWHGSEANLRALEKARASPKAKAWYKSPAAMEKWRRLIKHNAGLKKIKKPCVFCDELFLVHPTQLKKARFCSIRCKMRFRRAKAPDSVRWPLSK